MTMDGAHKFLHAPACLLDSKLDLGLPAMPASYLKDLPILASYAFRHGGDFMHVLNDVVTVQESPLQAVQRAVKQLQGTGCDAFCCLPPKWACKRFGNVITRV